MEVSKKIAVSVVVLCIGIGAVIGSKTVSRPETATVIKDRIVTVTRQIKRPDGTVERQVERTEDRSKVVTVAKPNWLAGVQYGVTSDVPYYGVSVHYRVIKDVFVGASVTTRGDVMASVIVTF